MTILVAEDDLSSRKIIETLLRKRGHEVITAEDGLQAWAILKRKDAPRLLILDWLMPGIDGEQLCKNIRAEEKEIPVYIIMLTIKGEKNDIIRGLESGANDYLSKPYDAGELYARIDVGGKIIGLESTLIDKITTLRINEKKIETLLAEKDLLLYEVHHRIKNNMNTAINLLTLQADTIKQNEASESIRNAASRLKSMSVLYDKLYRSDNLSAMSVKKYLPSLIDDIISIFPDRYKVQVDLEISDFILDVHQLSSLGMILNELLVNSMKHAFVGRDTGTITLTVYKKNKRVNVIFEDDGIGIPANVTLDDPSGFGMRLIKGVAGQIGGTINMTSGKGTRYILEFGVNY